MRMMKTPLGSIFFLIDGQIVGYRKKKLPLAGRGFVVEGRYEIVLSTATSEKKEIVLECALENKNNSFLRSGSETGENLALLSFYSEDIKLSIGTRGDIPGVVYEYQKNGMIMTIPKSLKMYEIVFYIAWTTINDCEKEGIYTWLAADPTL